MHFAIQKDTLVKALKDVTSALATRVVQPILSNVLIEALDEATIKFQATDLDLTIETKTPAVVYTQGAITLPGKKLLEIVSKLPSELVSFQVDVENYETSITCKRSKFSISGLSPADYPKTSDARPEEALLMPGQILKKAIGLTAFAAASYDASSILGGVYIVINDGVFECTATDGSRLAHRKEELNILTPAASTTEGDKEREALASTATLERPTSLKAIIPAKACTEIVKLMEGLETLSKGEGDIPDLKEVRIGMIDGQIVFESDTHYISTRLISGEYPRYQDLFPTEHKCLAIFNREELMKSIDRVAVMSDDRTHLVKLHFEGNTLQISANTPDVGKAQEEISITYDGEPLDVAVNVRYMVDVLQRLTVNEIRLEMLGSLKPLILKGVDDQQYKYLLMPVQAK
ncbi:MAG: DNA polymerase III subunit beta [Candidatus Obscuribacterales bacterium]|nr:DNA polymerase III subunit beta [Candidatus Obscuribacterales bacterium]